MLRVFGFVLGAFFFFFFSCFACVRINALMYVCVRLSQYVCVCGRARARVRVWVWVHVYVTKETPTIM